MSSPTLSIILCTYNRAASLRRTLETLCALQIPLGLTWELLLVDNNSTDATKQVGEEFRSKLPIRYLFEPRQGKSYALNTAVEAAGGDLLLFTDDDVDVDPNWLAGYQEAADRHAEVGFFGGRILPRWATPPPPWVVRNLGQLNTIVHLDWGDAEKLITDPDHAVFPGANVAFRRTTFAGGLHFRQDLCPTGSPDSIWGNVRGEENILEQGLLRAGQSGLYVPTAIVHHRHPPQRCTEKFLRTYYSAQGISLVRRSGTMPCGPYLFGAPRRWWVRLVLQALRFLKVRWLTSDRVWLEAEINMATTWGEIAEVRRLSALSIQPGMRFP